MIAGASMMINVRTTIVTAAKRRMTMTGTSEASVENGTKTQTIGNNEDTTKHAKNHQENDKFQGIEFRRRIRVPRVPRFMKILGPRFMFPVLLNVSATRTGFHTTQIENCRQSHKDQSQHDETIFDWIHHLPSSSCLRQ
eukprot:134718_1